MDEFSWAYAAGRIKIVEKELLSESALRQVVDAKTLESAVASLRETCYGRYLAEMGQSSSSFDLPLQKALRDAYESVLSYAGEPLAVTVFRSRHDFHNVKVSVKGRCLGIPREEEALSIVGNLGVLALDSLLQDSGTRGNASADQGGPDFTGRVDLAVEEEALVKAYRAASDLVEKEKANRGPVALALLADSSVDRSYYGWAAASLKRMGYPELTRFLTAEVDLIDLRMALRATRQRIPGELFDKLALFGGDVAQEALRGAYAEGPQQVEALYAATPWASLAKTGAGLIQRKESLTACEKACDDALMQVYRRGKFISMGPEPVVGYLLGKEAEVRNLRVVLAGKQSQVPAPEILERLRETYV